MEANGAPPLGQSIWQAAIEPQTLKALTLWWSARWALLKPGTLGPKVAKDPLA